MDAVQAGCRLVYPDLEVDELPLWPAVGNKSAPAPAALPEPPRPERPWPAPVSGTPAYAATPWPAPATAQLVQTLQRLSTPPPPAEVPLPRAGVKTYSPFG